MLSDDGIALNTAQKTNNAAAIPCGAYKTSPIRQKTYSTQQEQTDNHQLLSDVNVRTIEAAWRQAKRRFTALEALKPSTDAKQPTVRNRIEPRVRNS